MQKILSITSEILSTGSHINSNSLTTNEAQKISAISMFLKANPTAGGLVPTEAELQVLERMVSVRISKDPQQQNLFTKNFVAVAAFQSKELGFVPVTPFIMANSEQFTVEWQVLSNNVYLIPAFVANSSGIYLDVILWGDDGRAA
jgi:hypothetical protein